MSAALIQLGSATTIVTDNFDGLTYTTETGWGSTGPASTGQWTVAALPAGPQGRTAIDDNQLGYTGVPTPPSGTGYGQFSNGNNGTWTGTLTDTAGHAFNAGDKVTIDLFAAGRNVGSGALTINVSLIGAATINLGNFTPTVGSWNAVSSNEGTIVTAGTYNVQFTSIAQSGDRTTFIDNVSYDVTEVPEPSSAALLGLGGLALILRRRK
ncbi:MAG: PEP-CTERM sorting domain-containing protein [Akkermansiaceae bacterium]|nr:PEP-CTERM sorting domain-containing protein [Akkermansiaceae bacterium]